MSIVVNPVTGVEYDEISGNSTKRYVAVEADGTIRNPGGDKWPYGDGLPHTQPYDYYELVPFVSAPYDSELFIVDSENSGWSLKPKTGGAPAGHPQGTYEYTETIKRRNVDELKALAKGYADRYNSELWPQENGYTEKLVYAKEQVDANNRLPQFTDLIERHERLISASFHNDARLYQLYSEIEAAGDKQITNAVATTTTATLTFDVAHGITIGKRIAVKDLPAPFARLNGGSFVVTAVTTSSPFTLSYDSTGPAIATAAVATGVVTRAIDFVVSQMATEQFPEGWVNGIAQ
jgi:hypothetical protein